MKHISFFKRNLFLALGAFVLLGTSCIKEDLEACYTLTLKVVNEKSEDITPLGNVTDASLFVFDENKTLLETRQLDADFIINRRNIELSYPEGTKLFLVAYGNLAGGNQTVKKGTKAEELFVALNTTAEGRASSPDSLFYGNKTVETIGAGGYVGGNQEIVIDPRTGTVTMITVNLDKAIVARGGVLKAGEEPQLQFQVDRTMESLDYNGEKSGKEVYFNPDGKYDKSREWATPNQTNMYTDKQLLGSIYYNGAKIGEAENALNETTGEMEPITVYPRKNTLIKLEWGNNGAFIGAKVKITPWGVVDEDIEF